MKRRVLLLVITVWLLTILCPVSAASPTYTIEELGITLSIPTQFQVLTRDTPADSPLLDLYGWDKESLDAEMEAECAYIYAYTPTTSYSEGFFLYAAESDIRDYNTVPDSDLEAAAIAFAEDNVEEYPYIDYGIYRTQEHTFIFCTYLNTAYNELWAYYETAANGLFVQCYYSNSDSAFTTAQEEMLLSIIDSIRFDSPTSVTIQPEQEVTLTVPISQVDPTMDPTVVSEEQAELVYSILVTILVIIIVFACGGILLIVLLLSKAKKARSAPRNLSEPKTVPSAPMPEGTEPVQEPLSPPEESPQETPETTAVPQILFCRHCGTKLPAECVFCPNCGTQINPDTENQLRKDTVMHPYYCIPAETLGENSRIPLRFPGDSQAVFTQIAQEMVSTIRTNNEAGKHTVFICPVGPVGQYPIFVNMVNRERLSLKQCWFFNMDEYLNDDGTYISMTSPLSFRGFMERTVYSQIDPELVMPPQQRIFPDPQDPARLDRLLRELGGADICFGGIGINGHLAFNEASEELSPEAFADLGTRVLSISRETRTANAIGDLGGAIDAMPKLCVTIGMAQILGAKKVRLGVFRDWHRAVVRQAAYGEITAHFPVSLLQNHPDALIYVNDNAAIQPFGETR